MDIKIKQEYLLKELKENKIKFELIETNKNYIKYEKRVLMPAKIIGVFFITLELHETYDLVYLKANIEKNLFEKMPLKMINLFNIVSPECTVYLEEEDDDCYFYQLTLRHGVYNPYNFDAKAFLEILPKLYTLACAHYLQLREMDQRYCIGG